MVDDRNDGVSDPTVREALEHFEHSEEGSTENREAYEEDTKFARSSDQWPAAIKKQRVQEGRPCLVINKMPPLIRSVVNESKQNKPAIVVSPVDNGADPDTAEVIQGLTRSIERNSNAQVAYGTAIDHSVTGGFGFFRLDIDFAHPETFELEVGIKRIPNALSVHWDTASTEFDASDWNYAFISDHLDKDDFKRMYPDASMVPFDGNTMSDASAKWLDDDRIRVSEYFKRTEKERKLIQFKQKNPETGQDDILTMRWDQMPQLAAAFFEGQGVQDINVDEDGLAEAFIQAANITIVADRMAKYYEVMRYMINGVEVLEENRWPGSTIPICPVWGDEHYMDGVRHFKSLIRDAKDPQTMHNFWRSATTELVALAPKAPWVGPKGFIPSDDDNEVKWANANSRSYAFLEYEPAAGAAPERQAFAGIPTGALNEAVAANEDMQAITGIYPSAIGAQSNETSGKAILARERQGDVSNFHFLDNLARAIQYAGRCIVEVIPSVYSTRETIRILGEDSTEKVIKLTQEAGGTQGDEKLYNLSVGRYDVTVKTGPSFSTQREETRETLIELMRAVPAAAPIIGDALMEHMDFIGNDKIAKRLKAMLPPEIRALEDEKITEAENPEAAALQVQLDQGMQKFKQLQQQGQMLAQELEQLKKSKAADAEGKRLDNQTKQMELNVKLEEAKARLAELQPSDNLLAEKQGQWAYDMAVLDDKQAHEAIQNDADRQIKEDEANAALAAQESKQQHDALEAAADRQVDLAKVILAQAGKDEATLGDDTLQNALVLAAEMLDPSVTEIIGGEA
jgi:hypothetical protein|tara:strand:- start:16796 stop:19189 length:2394 start_codon:yes stop_codon:yes gene_type:complete